MDKEDLKKSTCINLRCVTQSSKGGVPLNQLENDYRLLLGTSIPFKDLGYSSLENFLRDIPDVICLKKSANGSLIAEAVADASTAHIAQLISKQKSSKKSKSGSAKPAVVTRTWGSSGKSNSYLKMKTPLKDCNSLPPRREHKQNSNFVHLTPAQQELKKSVLINLRSVVQSCKNGVPLNQLQRDYRKFIGSNIPFENLGYSTLYEFIQSIPDVINLKMDVNKQFIAIGVVDKTTAHLFGSSVTSKPSKSVKPTNEASANDIATLQISSEKKVEPSFFKLSQNAMELSEINNVLKYAPAQKRIRKKTRAIYSVAELIGKNKTKPESKEELLKVEHPKAFEPVFSCEENSVPEVSLSKADINSSQNPNEIAETIKNQIKIAGLGPLVWMNFILYGPTEIEILRRKILSFYGFPFSADSKEWKEKKSLLSELPKKVLQQSLFLLRIEYGLKDTKEILQNKLFDFLATFTEKTGTNPHETEEENKKELHASTLTLSSVSSGVSKCSYFADTETSDAVLSDRKLVSPKVKPNIVSNSDSDLMELPLDKESLLKKSSHHLKDTKKSVQVEHSTDKRSLLKKSSHHLKDTKKSVQVEHSTDKRNFHVESCEGIHGEKRCDIKHSTNTKSTLLKSFAGKVSAVQKQQSLDKNSVEQKVDMEKCSMTETSSPVSTKTAKRNRRKKRRKDENAQKNVGLSIYSPLKHYA